MNDNMTNIDYKQKCLNIYYASDVVNIERSGFGNMLETRHPPTLASWLRLIEVNHPRWVFSPFGVKIGIVSSEGIDWRMIPFNLTTEEPTDWEALYQIIK